MSDPVIDRRCNVCGASVRPSAIFCPQCGSEIANQPKATEPTVAAHVAETVTDLSETQPLVVRPDLSKTQPLTPTVAEQVAHSKSSNSRKSDLSADSEGNLKARVEKLRKVSSVMIDEAAYDPSLRFILVTAVLFILFVVLLIFSKVLG